MLRDRIKDLDLKITELADYLQISRPTMYKFIEDYDNQNFDLINKKVLKLFKYIDENELIGKKNVINYILNNLVDVKELGDKQESDDIKCVKKYLINNTDTEKYQFVVNCCKKSGFDIAIHYLMEISKLIKKRNLTLEEEKKLKPYKEIIEIYKEDI